MITDAKRKAKRNKITILRFRKNDPEHNLLVAAQHFIRAHGGDALVIGGIEIQHDWKPYRFKIAVGWTGKWPDKELKA